MDVKPFDHNLINPTESNYTSDIGGSKIVVIGKPGSGKSTLIKYLILLKRNLIPVGMVVSGTEDSNHFYANIIPHKFTHTQYSDGLIQSFIRRQKIAISYLSIPPNNPWAFLLLDDCTDDKKIFYSQLQQSLFKNGRHWKMLYILSLQHPMDIPPSIRTNIDGIFIFKDTNETNLKNIYLNYAGIFPNINIFKEYMNQVTGDYIALYIDNSSSSQNKEWHENIYYIKAPLIQDETFGCNEFNTYEFNDPIDP